MERKIGEIFEYNGEWYQCVVTGFSCADCDIKGDCSSTCIGACSSRLRKDGKQVRFKKLEKVGEPYHNSEKKLCQQYKCYINPLVTDEIVYVFADNRAVIEIKQTNKDMEEKKLNLKPFDIQKAREGKPVCTRDGRNARIICFDRVTNTTNEYTGHLIVLVTNPNGDEQSFYYTEKGNLAGEDEYDNHKYDLMMLPEKKEGWVNVYKKSIYNTKEEAFNRRDKENYLMTIKVGWEE